MNRARISIKADDRIREISANTFIYYNPN